MPEMIMIEAHTAHYGKKEQKKNCLALRRSMDSKEKLKLTGIGDGNILDAYRRLRNKKISQKC